MDAPPSFNELTVEAKRLGIRLETLREDDHGFWVCAWRRGQEIYPRIERRVPFTAMVDAYLLARDNGAEPPAAAPEFDLFG